MTFHCSMASKYIIQWECDQESVPEHLSDYTFNVTLMFYGGHVILRAGRNIYYWLRWRWLESCPQNSFKYQAASFSQKSALIPVTSAPRVILTLPSKCQVTIIYLIWHFCTVFYAQMVLQKKWKVTNDKLHNIKKYRTIILNYGK